MPPKAAKNDRKEAKTRSIRKKKEQEGLKEKEKTQRKNLHHA